MSAKLRQARCPASVPNEACALDFLSQQLVDGRRIRVLTIIATFGSLSPTIDVRHGKSQFFETLEPVAVSLTKSSLASALSY